MLTSFLQTDVERETPSMKAQRERGAPRATNGRRAERPISCWSLLGCIASKLLSQINLKPCKVLTMAEKIPGNIPQIGAATLAILRQKEIATNLDVLYVEFPSTPRPFGDTADARALKNIPGLGPGREALLREWAEQVPLLPSERYLLSRGKLWDH